MIYLFIFKYVNMTYSVVNSVNSIPDKCPSGGGCRDDCHSPEHPFLYGLQYYNVRHSRSKPEQYSTGKCDVLCSYLIHSFDI